MTAVLYGIGSVLIVGFVVKGQWDERAAELDSREYTVEVPDGRVFLVRAQSESEAQSTVENYATARDGEMSDAEVFGTSEQTSAVRPAKGDSVPPPKGTETPPWLDYAASAPAADAPKSGGKSDLPSAGELLAGIPAPPTDRSAPDASATADTSRESEPSKGKSSATENGEFDGSVIFAEQTRTSKGKSTAPKAAIGDQVESHPSAEAKAARAAAVPDASDIFARPSATANAARAAAASVPVRLVVQKYEHPRSLAAVLQAGAKAAMWCALVYVAFWAMFRGIRWVALGFMEAKASGPSE